MLWIYLNNQGDVGCSVNVGNRIRQGNGFFVFVVLEGMQTEPSTQQWELADVGYFRLGMNAFRYIYDDVNGRPVDPERSEETFQLGDPSQANAYFKSGTTYKGYKVYIPADATTFNANGGHVGLSFLMRSGGGGTFAATSDVFIEATYGKQLQPITADDFSALLGLAQASDFFNLGPQENDDFLDTYYGQTKAVYFSVEETSYLVFTAYDAENEETSQYELYFDGETFKSFSRVYKKTNGVWGWTDWAKMEINQIKSVTATPITGGTRITITLTNGDPTTFDVMNGEKGDKGDKGDQGPRGATGNGIASIAKISTEDLEDTYRITYTDGNHFDFVVTNGSFGGYIAEKRTTFDYAVSAQTTSQQITQFLNSNSIDPTSVTGMYLELHYNQLISEDEFAERVIKEPLYFNLRKNYDVDGTVDDYSDNGTTTFNISVYRPEGDVEVYYTDVKAYIRGITNVLSAEIVVMHKIEETAVSDFGYIEIDDTAKVGSGTLTQAELVELRKPISFIRYKTGVRSYDMLISYYSARQANHTISKYFRGFMGKGSEDFDSAYAYNLSRSFITVTNLNSTTTGGWTYSLNVDAYVDKKPTDNSTHLVTSGGVYDFGMDNFAQLGKYNGDGTGVEYADQASFIHSDREIEDPEDACPPIVFGPTGGDAEISSGFASFDYLEGNTVGWNQLVINGDFATTDGWIFNNGNGSVSNNVLTVTYTSISTSHKWGMGIYQSFTGVVGHKYLLVAFVKPDKTTTCQIALGYQDNNNSGDISITANQWNEVSFIVNGMVSQNYPRFQICPDARTWSIGDKVQYKQAQIFDLTQLYGAGKEPTTVSQFKKDYPLPYYAYDAGSLKSANMKSVTSTMANQFDGTFEQGSLSNSTGEEGSSANAIRTDFIEVIGGQTYSLTQDNFVYPTDWDYRGVYKYDASKNFLGFANKTTGNNQVLLEAECRYVRLCYARPSAMPIPTDAKVMFRLYYDTPNLPYAPYEADTISFPSGLDLKSAGNVRDIAYADGTGTRYVGSVDLSQVQNLLVYDNGFGCWVLSSYDYKGKYAGTTSGKPNIIASDGTPVTSYYGDKTNAVTIRDTGLILIGNGSSTTKPTCTLYYELATATSFTHAGWSSQLKVDNYGTLLFAPWNDTQPVIPQAYFVKYTVNLVEWLDSAYVHTDGDPSNIALKSEVEAALTEAQTVGYIEINDTDGEESGDLTAAQAEQAMRKVCFIKYITSEGIFIFAPYYDYDENAHSRNFNCMVGWEGSIEAGIASQFRASSINVYDLDTNSPSWEWYETTKKVDEAPTLNSDNLVTSGGVRSAVSALDSKISKNAEDIAALTEALIKKDLYETQEATFLGMTAVPAGAMVKAYLDGFKGNSAVVNQLVQNGNFADTSVWSASEGGSFSVSNNICTYSQVGSSRLRQLLPTIPNHTYYVHFFVKATANCYVKAEMARGWVSVQQAVTSGTKTEFSQFITPTSTTQPTNEYFQIFANQDTTLEIELVNVIDLTINSITSSVSSEVKELLKHKGMDVDSYVPYNAGTLTDSKPTKLYSRNAILKNVSLKSITTIALNTLGFYTIGSNRWQVSLSAQGAKKNSASSEMPNIYCSKYTALSPNDWEGAGDKTMTLTIDGFLRIRDSSITQASDFSGTLFYQLATPSSTISQAVIDGLVEHEYDLTMPNLKSAGSVQDESKAGGEKVGKLDLSVLHFVTASYGYISPNRVAGMKYNAVSDYASIANILASKYTNASYNDVSQGRTSGAIAIGTEAYPYILVSDTSAPSGNMNYELATPTDFSSTISYPEIVDVYAGGSIEVVGDGCDATTKVYFYVEA